MLPRSPASSVAATRLVMIPRDAGFSGRPLPHRHSSGDLWEQPCALVRLPEVSRCDLHANTRPGRCHIPLTPRQLSPVPLPARSAGEPGITRKAHQTGCHSSGRSDSACQYCKRPSDYPVSSRGVVRDTSAPALSECPPSVSGFRHDRGHLGAHTTVGRDCSTHHARARWYRARMVFPW